jgi:hypothetical protein
VLGCLGYSRAGARALVFSKEIPELPFGIRRCLWRLGALPQTLVWDRQAGLHAGGGRPTEAFAATYRKVFLARMEADKPYDMSTAIEQALRAPRTPRAMFAIGSRKPPAIPRKLENRLLVARF